MKNGARIKRYLKNRRSSSLVNVDAEIASKAAVMRMRRIIAKVIRCDQTAYFSNQYICESNRLDENDIDAILFSADFEKVFDAIEHPFSLQFWKLLDWMLTLFSGSERFS